MKLSVALTALAYTSFVVAQFPDQSPKNIKTILSDKFPGAKVTYKQVKDVCETTEGVKSYSGFVHLPSELVPEAGGKKGLSPNETAKYHFWFFEARNDPDNAPTSFYMGGGPGYSGYDGSSNFPCYFNADGNSTTLNKYSWNTNVNMVYVDQPLGVGFSHTTLHNGTLNLEDGSFEELEEGDDVPDGSVTATLQLRDPETLINSTMAAARTFWTFAQVFLNDFSERRTDNDDIAIWAVSYGGFYASQFAWHFQEQNIAIQDGKSTLKNASHISLNTIGIINGVMDYESVLLGYPEFAMNNTYGKQLYSEAAYEESVKALAMPDGCFDQMHACRAIAKKDDPEFWGKNDKVNEVCAKATGACLEPTIETFTLFSPYNRFDFGLQTPAYLPYEYETGFLNQPWVQAELGVPLNFTRGNNIVPDAFFKGTGDPMRHDLSHLGEVIDRGVNVALVYGDRDFVSNWVSAENASLWIPFEDASKFAKAGYASIAANDTYDGGFVREHGNLSFSRVFQAGHSASWFQPETVSAIFERAMSRRDVATGKTNLTKNGDYVSEGQLSTFSVENEYPPLLQSICYALQPVESCTEDQQKALLAGNAKIENFIVVEPKGTKGEKDVDLEEYYKKGLEKKKEQEESESSDGKSTDGSGDHNSGDDANKSDEGNGNGEDDEATAKNSAASLAASSLSGLSASLAVALLI